MKCVWSMLYGTQFHLPFIRIRIMYRYYLHNSRYRIIFVLCISIITAISRKKVEVWPDNGFQRHFDECYVQIEMMWRNELYFLKCSFQWWFWKKWKYDVRLKAFGSISASALIVFPFECSERPLISFVLRRSLVTRNKCERWETNLPFGKFSNFFVHVIFGLGLPATINYGWVYRTYSMRPITIIMCERMVWRYSNMETYQRLSIQSAPKHLSSLACDRPS